MRVTVMYNCPGNEVLKLIQGNVIAEYSVLPLLSSGSSTDRSDFATISKRLDRLLDFTRLKMERLSISRFETFVARRKKSLSKVQERTIWCEYFIRKRSGVGCTGTYMI